MNILNEIVNKTKERIEQKKKILPPADIKKTAEDMLSDFAFPFENAIRKNDMAFICEIKKASPSKGVIANSFPYLKIAMDYQSAGATAISVLTEPFYFQGDDEYLQQISRRVSIPLLRKDFVIDSYMIYEAKVLGASAVLLICSILDAKILAEYIKISHSLGLSALVEAHDKKEIENALNAGARIIGVNNRDLKTFNVDITLSERLRAFVPKDKLFIAESGIQAHADVVRLKKAGVNGVLIGETLMKSPDKITALKTLRGVQ